MKYVGSWVQGQKEGQGCETWAHSGRVTCRGKSTGSGLWAHSGQVTCREKSTGSGILASPMKAFMWEVTCRVKSTGLGVLGGCCRRNSTKVKPNGDISHCGLWENDKPLNSCHSRYLLHHRRTRTKTNVTRHGLTFRKEYYLLRSYLPPNL